MDACDNLQTCIMPGVQATTSTIIKAAKRVIGPISKPNRYGFDLMSVSRMEIKRRQDTCYRRQIRHRHCFWKKCRC